MKKELARVANRSDLAGARRIVLTDSSVALGAWGKGRSSSAQLNRVLRAAMGWSVLGFLKLIPLWVPTFVNPADYPSRFKPLPPPSEVAQWLIPHFRHDMPWKVTSHRARAFIAGSVRALASVTDTHDMPMYLQGDSQHTCNPCAHVSSHWQTASARVDKSDAIVESSQGVHLSVRPKDVFHLLNCGLGMVV